MPPLDEALPLIRAAAADPDGPPAGRSDEREPFAAMVAALLGRQVTPSVVEAVLDALRHEGLLDPVHLDLAAVPEVQDALRGKVRSISVRTLAPAKQLAHWLVEQHGVRGVGVVGADAILLAAMKRPAYPVDRGTYRILVRHGWLDPSATYDEARERMVHQADGDPDVLIRLSDGMDALASRFCRASAPRCDACPLRSLLPEGGPLGADD
jgi:endonuclease III related protein